MSFYLASLVFLLLVCLAIIATIIWFQHLSFPKGVDKVVKKDLVLEICKLDNTGLWCGRIGKYYIYNPSIEYLSFSREFKAHTKILQPSLDQLDNLIFAATGLRIPVVYVDLTRPLPKHDQDY